MRKVISTLIFLLFCIVPVVANANYIIADCMGKNNRMVKRYACFYNKPWWSGPEWVAEYDGEHSPADLSDLCQKQDGAKVFNSTLGLLEHCKSKFKGDYLTYR